MPHTITLQPSSFRNLRLPKRLRVIYFLARTRLAQRLIMVPATPTRRPALTVLLPFAFVLGGCSPGPCGPWKPSFGKPPLLPFCPDLVVSGVRSLSLEKQLVSSGRGVCPE